MRKIKNRKAFKEWKIRYGVLSDTNVRTIRGATLTQALKFHWTETFSSFKEGDLGFKIEFAYKNNKVMEIWTKITKSDGTVSSRYERMYRVIEILKGDIPSDIPVLKELTEEQIAANSANFYRA